MKKLLTLLAVACLSISIAGCGDDKKKDGAKKDDPAKKENKDAP